MEAMGGGELNTRLPSTSYATGIDYRSIKWTKNFQHIICKNLRYARSAVYPYDDFRRHNRE